MFTLLSRSARKGVLALVLSTGCSSHVLAAEDVLVTPSYPTKIAHENLLLDVTVNKSRWVAVGTKGHIIYSEDEGSSWQQSEVPVSVLLTSLSFPSDNMGWAVGHGGIILHSSDGGLTWQKQFDGDEANRSIVEQAKDYVAELEEVVAAAEEDDLEELEYQLEDAQFALEDAEIDAEVGPSKPFLDVFFLNDRKGFALGAYGLLFATQDGGKSWTNYGNRLENIDRFHLNGIGQTADGTLIIAGEAGVMFRSLDEGESWETLYSPYEGSWFGVLSLEKDDTAIVYGLRGNLYRTEDGGESWDQLESNTTNTLMGASYDGATGVTLTGNSGVILSSKNRGRTFQEFIREDRLGNVSLAYTRRGELVMVGESGVNIINSSGQNL